MPHVSTWKGFIVFHKSQYAKIFSKRTLAPGTFLNFRKFHPHLFLYKRRQKGIEFITGICKRRQKCWRKA